jgi:hypothetical protein
VKTRIDAVVDEMTSPPEPAVKVKKQKRPANSLPVAPGNKLAVIALVVQPGCHLTQRFGNVRVSVLNIEPTPIRVFINIEAVEQ